MPKTATNPNTCGVVQVIRLHWEKSARGGEGARHRNAVPQAFSLSAAVLEGTDARLRISIAHFGEQNDFAQPFSIQRERVALTDGFTFGCVGVSLHPDGLLVRYQYNKADGGAPDRGFLNYPSGTGEVSGRSYIVRPGEWGRVCYNGRFSDVQWWYEQVTVNVACFSAQSDARVFLDQKPDHELNFLADLR